MRFEIDHLTRYDYSQAVFLEPHSFRLRPRSDSFQRLIRYELQVNPKPVVLSETLDAEGNSVAHAWFAGATEFLELHVKFEAETLRPNAFDYLLLDKAGELPLQYSESLRLLLAPALVLDSGPAANRQQQEAGLNRQSQEAGPVNRQGEEAASANRQSQTDGQSERGGGTAEGGRNAEPSAAAASNGPVAEFAATIAAGVNGQILPFLSELSRRIHQEIDMPIREVGQPLPAEQTLREKRGACRDASVLFMECCRSQGIAARFVSGYQEGDNEAERRYMHAWAEVYLPGGGWRGYDPTHGLAIADRHIAVAASARPEMAAPTRGTFRGTGAASRMHTDLKIHTK
jgi:transglutaminase-like putative cysteine protease